MEENSVKNKVRPQNKHLKPFKKGDERINRGGHKLGQKNYATLRREAIIAVGKLNNKTPEEIEIMLHSKGISEALKGNFQFYKDDLDRTYGQATAKTELTGAGGKDLFTNDEKENARKAIKELVG